MPPLLRCLIYVMLGTPWLACAQASLPDIGGFPTSPSREKDIKDLTGDGSIWRVERRQPMRGADQLEERLAMLRPSGVDKILAREKLLEGIRQAKRHCPECMTVLAAEAGSLGAEPGRLGRCNNASPVCPPGRPFVNSATGVCTSVAEIKALP